MEFTLKFPLSPEEIKEETKKLRDMITARQAEIRILQTALKAIQDTCTHNGSSCVYCGYYWDRD